MEWERNEFLLTDDPRRVDVDRTFALLSTTYWGVRRSKEVVLNMIPHSLCFTLLHDKVQVGFGRAVTDYTVFSWIADIVVDSTYRAQGLGKWSPALMSTRVLGL